MSPVGASPFEVQVNMGIIGFVAALTILILAACPKVNADEQETPPNAGRSQQQLPIIPVAPPRTDIHISGIYPHLTTYGVYSQNGAHFRRP